MNWTGGVMLPVVAPDVETALSKDGNSPRLELAVWVCVGLASSLVTVRIYYHLFRGRRHLWSDDYLLIAALLCVVGNSVTIREWIRYKLEPNVTTAAAPGIVFANWLVTGSLMGLFNSFALAFSKTSLGITFMRLTSGWWKCSLGLYIFVIDIMFVVQAWTYWVQDCDGPSEPFRLQSTAVEGCITFESVTSFRLTVQLLSCVLDVYLTILPWKIVHSLELKRFEKIGLATAMSFGCASLISGMVRLVILVRLSYQSYDHQPFYSVGGFLFNFFEPGYSIVAACIPVLRKIIMDQVKSKKRNSGPTRTSNRRKKQDPLPVLPITEFRKGSAFEGTSQATDTTLVLSTAPTEPGKTSSLRSYCHCDHPAQSLEVPNRKLC